ncbi:hypothetical protein [Ralstonia sp.]|uniref:hypothetical protein n=1 Tax=Ralstonia sp. TaxID=54061 RepID=UPI0031E1FCC2
MDTLYARMVYARNQQLAARSASAAGLEVASAGTVSVMEGSTLAGKVAINELRVIPLARIAARVATASAPIAIAMIAADLVNFGIKQCSESGTGWCKRAPANPNESDDGFNGFVWQADVQGNSVTANSPGAACSGGVAAYNASHPDANWSLDRIEIQGGTGARCWIRWPAQNIVNVFGYASRGANCVSGYVPSGGNCVVDSSKPATWLPASYPELSDKLAQALSGNPDRAKDYWGITPLDGWKAWFDEPTSQAKVAEVVSPADGKVNGTPRTSTTSAGTTTTNTQYTIKPNTDANTLRDAPVTAGTTVTVTNPDGTTTTVTTGDAPVSGGGGAAPKVEVKSCGLADTAPCKIDETGTPTYKEPSVAKDKMDDADNRLKTKLDNIGEARPDQFGIGDIVKPLEGACAPFAYAIPKGAGVESVDIDLCPTLDLTRTGATWVWVFVSAVACILLVRDAINGG